MDGPGATADPAPSDWDDRLHAHGYRVTPQRALVLAAVNDLGHATPEEILVRVQGESRASISPPSIARWRSLKAWGW